MREEEQKEGEVITGVSEHNEEHLEKVKGILKSGAPEGIKNILILTELFACKTTKGEIIGEQLLKSIEPERCENCGQILRQEGGEE